MYCCQLAWAGLGWLRLAGAGRGWSVLAEAGSGGCQMVKEERVKAKRPFLGKVNIGHRCTNIKTDDTGMSDISGWTRFLQCGERFCTNMSRQIAHIVAHASDLDFIIPYLLCVISHYTEEF